jgi:Ni,Fe-hydrogenase maturation factor
VLFKEQFPEDVVVLLIEAESVDFGLGLSSPVSAAVGKVAKRIEALIQERLAEPVAP